MLLELYLFFRSSYGFVLVKLLVLWCISLGGGHCFFTLMCYFLGGEVGPAILLLITQ